MGTSSGYKGYLSEEQKSKFTITAGILGASFLILQFFLPFIIIMIMMPSMFLFQGKMMQMQRMARSTVLGNTLWYCVESMGGPRQGHVNPVLKKVDLLKDSEPEKVCELTVDSPYLLNYNNEIWFLNSTAIGRIISGKPNVFSNTKILGDIYKPFIYKGKLSVIEKTPEGFFLVSFQKEDWGERRKLDLEGSNEACKLRDVQIVVLQNEKVYLFAQFGGTVYYRQDLPFADKKAKIDWTPVPFSSWSWFASAINNQVRIYYTNKRQGFASIIKGVKLEKDKWTDCLNYETPVMGKFTFHPLSGDNFIISLASFPGSFTIIKGAGDTVTEKIRHGRGFPFPPGMMAMMFIPHLFSFLLPLVLAIILSTLMFKYRITTYSHEEKEMAFAPLTRRALAQIIDAAFAGGPMVIGAILVFRNFFDFEEMLASPGPPLFILSGFLFIFAGVAWGFICLFLFSWWEGSYGQTPGKWCLGIQVLGSDLEFCGFGRAIVRNLLKFVDGFMQFMVGIMLIALTENWQRVGDLAARTIVVMKEKKVG